MMVQKLILAILLLMVVQRTSSLENPIHLISLPANKLEAVVRLHIFAIRIQPQGIISIYKPSGGETTATHFTSTHCKSRNAYYEWNDMVFEKGKNMTKEQFVKYDFKYRSILDKVRFPKDPYDGFKMPTIPHTITRKRVNYLPFKGITVTVEQREELDVQPLDFSLCQNPSDEALGSICDGLGQSRFSQHTVCVFLEGEPSNSTVEVSTDRNAKWMRLKGHWGDEEEAEKWLRNLLDDDISPLRKMIKQRWSQVATEVSKVADMFRREITFKFGVEILLT